MVTRDPVLVLKGHENRAFYICSGFFRIIIVCINKCAYIDNMLMLWVIVYRYVDEKQFLQIVEHML